MFVWFVVVDWNVYGFIEEDLECIDFLFYIDDEGDLVIIKLE